jgi:hypothetical protein
MARDRSQAVNDWVRAARGVVLDSLSWEYRLQHIIGIVTGVDTDHWDLKRLQLFYDQLMLGGKFLSVAISDRAFGGVDTHLASAI